MLYFYSTLFEKSINAPILSLILFENAKKILIVQVCAQGWRGLQKRRIASHERGKNKRVI